MDSDFVIHSSDDEETLLMKENLIKIRLRKKALAKSAASPSPQKSAKQQPSRPTTPPPKALLSLQNPFASPKSARSSNGNAIQVPVSPSPQKRRTLPLSPARILLGIDKGRTGRDVSLKRTPEKPSKTFNQRLSESKSLLRQQDQKTKDTSTRRTASFNPVPVFSSNTDEADEDTPTGLTVMQRKVAKEDCEKAAKTVSKIFDLHQFYAAVGPPEYSMSDDISDFIVFGIIASKTNAMTTSTGSKYCVLTLTDLKTDIALFLYDSAFEKYWTLAVGTLCYFLNPQYQKPKSAGSKLSLKMTDENSILEIARSADFGICRSVKKDGLQCTAWVNSKKQEVCDFHIDLTLSKSSNKRIEFASGTKLFDPRQPSKKKLKEKEHYAQHSVFFGDNVTTMKTPSGDDQEYEVPVKDTARLQREAESRQKEREVLARLMKNSTASAGHEYFETTDPNAAEVDIDETAERDRVYSAAMLRKLGFDPTKRLNQTSTTTASLYDNTVSAEDKSQERDLGLQKDGESVNLHVELGKGSALFTVAGLEAAAKSGETSTASLDQQADNEDSDSDLEIVR